MLNETVTYGPQISGSTNSRNRQRDCQPAARSKGRPVSCLFLKHCLFSLCQWSGEVRNLAEAGGAQTRGSIPLRKKTPNTFYLFLV